MFTRSSFGTIPHGNGILRPSYHPANGSRRNIRFKDGGTGGEGGDGGGSGGAGGSGGEGGEGGQGGSGGSGEGGTGGNKTPKTFSEAEWNAREAKHRQDMKRLADLEKAQKERDDAEKTEAQKERDRADEAQRELAKVRRENLQARIGAKHKLDPSLWDRLKGDTEEEMTADAEGLAKFLKVGEQKPGSTEGGAGGGEGNPPKAKTTKEQLEAQLAEAKKNRDLAAVTRIKTEIAQLK